MEWSIKWDFGKIIEWKLGTKKIEKIREIVSYP
jgi:hypothetical protein